MRELLLLSLHPAPDGGTSCVSFPAVPARGLIWSPNSSSQSFQASFCDFLTQPEDGELSIGAQVDVFPWEAPMGCGLVPTSAGGLPQKLGKATFVWDPQSCDQLPQEGTHTPRCSPDRKRAQSWLREVLMPTLSLGTASLTPVNPSISHTVMSLLSLGQVCPGSPL